MVLNRKRASNCAMRLLILILSMICLVLLSGCIEQEEDIARPAEESRDRVTVIITSPSGGQILKGDSGVLFEAEAKGGKEPYAYRWSSNLNGEISTKASFRGNPSDLAKGRHTIIATVKDANGISGQGSVQINVI